MDDKNATVLIVLSVGCHHCLYEVIVQVIRLPDRVSLPGIKQI
jgi:hypothetical protein